MDRVLWPYSGTADELVVWIRVGLTLPSARCAFAVPHNTLPAFISSDDRPSARGHLSPMLVQQIIIRCLSGGVSSAVSGDGCGAVDKAVLLDRSRTEWQQAQGHLSYWMVLASWSCGH